MIKFIENVESVLMDGRGAQLEALERVCDRRYLRGAGVDGVLAFLQEYRDRWALNAPIIEGVDVLISYWTARKA